MINSKIKKITNLAEFNKFFVKRDFADENSQTNKTVREIINNVKNKGDEAIFAYTKKLDDFSINSENYYFKKDEIKAAYKAISEEEITALKFAADRIKKYHLEQKPQDKFFNDESGNKLGWKWYPLDSVGLYIPGGLATYPSSVLMTATLAKIAGVPEIIAVSPTPAAKYNPAVLVACDICGVDKIFRIGGAQAIAALAYGSETINKVCKIFGPGNSYVTEAKKQLFSTVGIDMIAGPSEILILADKNNDPKWVATDLMSQAEHDKEAQAVLITDDYDFAHAVEEEFKTLLETNPRREIICASYNNYAHLFVISDLNELGINIINEIAPEHLEILVPNPENLLNSIKNAGAIFLGPYTAEAIGDYIAGPSHVLPTAGAAKFSSGLGIYDFMRRSSIVRFQAKNNQNILEKAEIIAESEKLPAHKLALTLRK